jgi:uncharacterized protein YndB with AHSA1/START domain
MVRDCIILSKLVDQERKEVWKYFTQTYHLQKWWGLEASIEAVLGGHFFEQWFDQNGELCITHGRIIKFKQNFCVQMLWEDDDWEEVTVLEIWFVAVKRKTRIKIKHSGFSVFQEEDRVGLMESHERGWKYHLNGLKRYAEDRGFISKQKRKS